MAIISNGRGAVVTWLCHFWNWWALIVALAVFFPLGFYTGFSVRQPTLTAPSTQALFDQAKKLDTFFVDVQSTQAKVVDDKVAAIMAADRGLKASTKPARDGGDGKSPAEWALKIDDATTALSTAVEAQNHAYTARLDTDLHRLRDIEKPIRDEVEASRGWRPAAYDQLKRFLKWIGAISFITLLAAILFVLALFNPDVRNRIAKTGTVSAFGLSFSFADVQTARESVQALQARTEDGVKAVYTKALRNSGLTSQFRKVMESVKTRFKDAGVDIDNLQYRATLFVPSFVGPELVQATRYLGTHNVGDETKIGRRFSIRFGIIGKAFRLQKCQYYPNVQNLNNNLVRDWGFTIGEAKPFPTSPGEQGSLMAFCINDAAGAPPLGVIYIEAAGGDQLNGNGRTGQLVVTDPDHNGLTSADHFAHDIWERVDPGAKDKLRAQLGHLQDLIRWNDKIQQGEGR